MGWKVAGSSPAVAPIQAQKNPGVPRGFFEVLLFLFRDSRLPSLRKISGQNADNRRRDYDSFFGIWEKE
jgi:hypothetical protein